MQYLALCSVFVDTCGREVTVRRAVEYDELGWPRQTGDTRVKVARGQVGWVGLGWVGGSQWGVAPGSAWVGARTARRLMGGWVGGQQAEGAGRRFGVCVMVHGHMAWQGAGLTTQPPNPPHPHPRWQAITITTDPEAACSDTVFPVNYPGGWVGCAAVVHTCVGPTTARLACPPSYRC